MNHLILLVITLLAQDSGKEILWDEKIRPQWADFRAKPIDKSPHAAATHYLINSYINYREGSNIEYEITCVFLRDKSWVKPKAKGNMDLLEHELLHFDIAECRARSLRKALNRRVSMSDAVEHLKFVQDSVRQEWREVQLLYDEETSHGVIDEEQDKWEVRIDSTLQALAAYSNTKLEVAPLDK